MVRVLMCGSRDFTNTRAILVVLAGVVALDPDATIVEGGARGADRIAARQSVVVRLRVEEFPADWDGPDGKRAGFVRNQKMLDSGIDEVHAFLSKPLSDSRGTADMVRRARAAGVPVYLHRAYE